MKRQLLLAAPSLIAFACAPSAHAQQTPPAAAGVEEIIVTARRKAESIQDVPQTLTAVTAADIEKLNLFDLSDIERVVAGLQIDGNNVSMRGVTFNPNAAAAPTTAMYLNDAPVLAAELFQSMFDVGQVEVLRGPQGTLRGISSPSGAITVTSRRPDVTTFGGSISVSVTDRDALNAQGAINIPLVRDALAVRIAGLINETEGNGVRSVHSSEDPEDDTEGVRASVRFEPVDSLTMDVAYQHLVNRTTSLGTAVFGNGSPGGVNPNAPAGYNGPTLGEFDRQAVAGYASLNKQTVDIATGQFDWTIANQLLTHVGSWQKYEIKPTSAIADTGNLLLGYPLQGSLFPVEDRIDTHELRLSSIERIAGMFDYVVGGFYQKDSVNTVGDNGPAAFLSGAFGAPGTIPVPGPPNTRYQINALISTPRVIEETSFFGNVTVHLGEKLEISGGARSIKSKTNSDLTVSTTAAFNATPGLPPGLCTALGGQFGATYAGVCDFPIPSLIALQSGQDAESKPWIYDASIAYRVTRDVMVYAHAGTSWREGPIGIGINNATNDPLLNSFIFLEPEESTSYEVGAKWTFLDGRGRLSADYFHQKYDGLIYGVPGLINYLSYTGAPNPTVATNPFFVNVPAKVDGVDLEAAIEFSRWSVSGNASWADGSINAAVPCNDGNFDGVPDGIIPTVAAFQAAGVLVATCNVEAGSSSAPDWNVRLQAEYHMPIAGDLEGFVNGLVAYQPENDNASQTYTVPDYLLVDLFIGLRGPDRKWEISLYGKNITETREILDQSAGFINPPAGLRNIFGDTGYRSVTLTPRRELGLNLRYAFGSR